MAKRAGVFLLAAALLAALPAAAQTRVPEGNRNVEQPSVPRGSLNRTRANQTTYDAKYDRVHALLKTDRQLMAKIRQEAGRYGIDPIHMIGAIVGEHTYNVDVYDRLQTYYVKAIAYLSSSLSFSHAGETISQFVGRPQMEQCDRHADSYDLWACRERVWNTVFRGKSVDGRRFPNDRFGAVFFQPYYAGQTFGIGQLNPLTALQMSDMVHRISGYEKLSADAPAEVYKAIMDPDRTLAYVAATIRTSIDAYRQIAGFDISRNPGITSTLYNLGDPEGRARALREENRKRRAAGQAPRLPQENYYGWLINDRIEQLRELL